MPRAKRPTKEKASDKQFRRRPSYARPKFRVPWKPQELALTYCRGRRHVALFMEMRLGKCLVVARWARRLGLRRVLVVAPLTALDQWAEELALEHIEGAWMLHGRGGGVAMSIINWAGGWGLVNYGTILETRKKWSGRIIRPGPRWILEADWDLVIFDESIRLKNPRASITKTCARYFRGVPHRAVLTGLPNPESDMDFFTQFLVLDGGETFGPDFWKWRRNRYHHIARAHEYVPRPGTTASIRKLVRANAFVMSCKDAGLGNKRLYQKRVVNHPPWVHRIIRRMLDEWVRPLSDGTVEETQWAPVRNSWLTQIAGGFIKGNLVSRAKLDEVLVLLRGELRNKQVVLWASYTAEIKELLRTLRKACISAGSIRGTTSKAERAERRRKFKAGKLRVLVVQPKCGKYALDLSAASTAIYYSNSYSYDDRHQSEARIENLGKREPLLYIDLVARNTIDEECRKALLGKHARSTATLAHCASRYVERLGGR